MANILEITKCNLLYEESKDVKQRMINEEGNIRKFQALIQQHTKSQNPKLAVAEKELAEREQILENLWTIYKEKTNAFIRAINEGCEQITGMKSQLINVQLEEFKIRQQKAQYGVPFEEKDDQLRCLQQAFNSIAMQSYELRKYEAWMIEVLTVAAQNNAHEQTCVKQLEDNLKALEQLFSELVVSSFIVSEQPPAVLRTGSKLGTEVRLLVDDKLGILKTQLDQASFTVKIVSEKTALQLMTGEMKVKDAKEIGNISIPVERMDKNEQIVTYKNSKLTSVKHRKQSKSGAMAVEPDDEQYAVATKYALLFQISPLNVGIRRDEQLNIWTLSNPLMIIVHSSQECLAHAAISWHHAFGPHGWKTIDVESIPVRDQQMVDLLKFKFSQFTGAHRCLSDSDLTYLRNKLLGPGGYDHVQTITYRQFAKDTISDGVFSFWKWFFAVMDLIKGKLIDFWNEGYLVGFISKIDASNVMLAAGQPICILRFSDSVLGSVSLGFTCRNRSNQVEPLHMQPFTIKDLEEFSLLQRIATCKELQNTRYVYPNKDKDQMLIRMKGAERRRMQSRNPRYNKSYQDSPVDDRCYVRTKLVMVAEMGNVHRDQYLPASLQTSPVASISPRRSSTSPTHQASLGNQHNSISGVLFTSATDQTLPGDQLSRLTAYLSATAGVDGQNMIANEDIDWESLLGPDQELRYSLDDVMDVIENQGNEGQQEVHSEME